MKLNYILPKLGFIFLTIIALASCEEELTAINSSIIEENFNTENLDIPVVSYSQRLGGVQTNGLSSYQMGVYNDPVFGKSTVNFLSQLTLGPNAIGADFGDCTVLDSVVLYIPFFSESTTTDDVTTYTTDSIFGNSPIDINIYESNLFLRNLDPDSNFEEQQRYYSTLGADVQANLGELLATVTDYVPNNEAVVLNDTTSLAPGLRVNLPIEFFEDKIIAKEGEQELLNNNNFREYFRGLFFEVTSTSDDGSLVFFDPSDIDDDNIGVTLYTSYKVLETGETCANTSAETLQRETRLFFNVESIGGIAANVYDNAVLPSSIATQLNNPDSILGEERLFVRGGEGIVTVIDLFGEDNFDPSDPTSGIGNGVEDLEDLRNEDWIINEANLIFYVDQDQVTPGSTEPERLIIYETRNHRVLVDYNVDLSGSSAPVDAVTTHLGRLERGSDDAGEFYKIRITTHLSNLINRDSINAPLGLIVSQNVAQTNFLELENALEPSGLSELPATSIISPEGTVLHGNRSSDPNKRLKLQIFYTEPE